MSSSESDNGRRAAEEKRATLARLLRDGRLQGHANLSPDQRRLWMLLQLDGSLPAQVLAAYSLRGALDLAVLQQAIAEVASRNEVLRSTFKDMGGTPLRVARPVMELALAVTEAAGTGLDDALQRLARQELGERLEPATGPLLRLHLVRLGAEEHLLLVKAHELISDEPSLEALIREVLATYGALLRGEQSAASSVSAYAEYAAREQAWLSGPVCGQQLEHWRRKLTDLPLLRLFTDRPRPVIKTHRCDSVSTLLPLELSRRMEALASRNGGLRAAVLAGFQVLLSRYTGQSDVTVGVRADLRTEAERGRLLGPASTALVLRTDLRGEPSFMETLQRVDVAREEAERFASVPFGTLVDTLQPARDLSRTPFFQVMYLFRDAREELAVGAGLRALAQALPFGTTPVDVTLAATATEQGLHLRIDFNSDLYDASTARRLLGHLRTLLSAAVDAPGMSIARLPLLTEEEWRQVVGDWNQTEHALPSRCLHELVEEQAARTPHAVAVTCEGHQLTYAELDAHANQLAHHLRQLGLAPEGRVAICLERSVEMVTAMLAVLKAGGAYVPLDPEYPTERLAQLFADCEAHVVLTQQSLADRVKMGAARRVFVDTDWPVIAGCPRQAPPPVVTPDHLAYLIYTSGSTGTPKAVMLSHRGIVNNLAWRQRTWPLSAEDRVLQNHSFSFDPSVWATFWPLLVGARAVLTPSGQHYDSKALVGLLREQGITVYGAVPSLNAVLMEEPEIGRCTHLRYVLSGAEALTGGLQRGIFSRVSAAVANLYGPTETTIDAAAWNCPRVDAPEDAPIGRPIANLRMYVLDEHLQPVPVGVPGELFVGGVGLARGYHARPGLTSQRFLPDPFSGDAGARLYRTGDLGRYRADGAIMFLGRVDEQVKVSGYRVELGEVETALGRHPDVREAIVVAREGLQGIKRLVAYVTPAKGGTPEARSLTAFLEKTLPAYMIPPVFVIVNELPKMPSGKVNRNALPAPQMDRPDTAGAYVAPRTPLEDEIASAFAGVLGMDRVGVEDDFFEVGGTSLLLARLASRLLNRFQIAIPVHQFFKIPTVAGVANVVETYQREGLDAVLMNQHATRLDADASLAPDISPAGLPLANYLAPSSVLLTGATGYLGAFLLQQLLKRTRATVYCLVRAADPAQAMDRVRATMHQYLVWDEAYAERIRPLVGDLGKPRLGLSREEWERLGLELDSIYHNGALVNFVYPYSALRGPNVHGTQEVLRLACQHRLKAVHYVSTIDVLLATHMPRPFMEDDAPLRNPIEVPGGYTGSKWVAEKVVNIARARGIPVCIYRPGLILSHEETGATQTNDYLLVAFRGYVPMGIIPDYPRIFDTIPVDYAAKAIVHISTQREALGRFFHLFNPAPVSLRRFCDWIRSYGYAFDIVPFDEARRQALDVDTSHPLYPLVPLIRDAEAEPQESLDPAFIDQLRPNLECRSAVEVLAGSDIRCPPMTEELAHRCLQYLVDIGFLQRPEVLRAARQQKASGA
ncbi:MULTISPECIES: amino acid adenylation domain-containing protein [unclassified Myxococcus]|uniref:amino acid adenylation domain-containing protein n=1 Tax=unclassified Myxococcus TaxID=2648731 RepID=UPI001C3C8103